MVLSDTQPAPVYERRLRQGGDLLLREASAFFAGGGTLRRTLHRLVKRLMAEDIPYALLGGLALGEHGYPRLTQDIDVLLSPAGLARFRERLVGRGYRPAFEGAQKTFRDSETGVRIEIVTAGEYPGDGLPKPVAFPDPAQPGVTVEVEGIRVISLEKLVELKLASGQSAPHRRRDLADVQDLIQARGLPAELAERLDASVRDLYRQLWTESLAARGGNNEHHVYTPEEIEEWSDVPLRTSSASTSPTL
jgi:hypothetical protein